MLKKPLKEAVIADEMVMQKIYLIRDQKVMLDKDLAKLYGIQTKVLKQAVKRNIARFPLDFMFILNEAETAVLRSQNVTLNRGEHSKYPAMAFTEQGVAMLSSVLHSEQAIKVNIQIIRVFTRMRELLLTHKDILTKLELLEEKYLRHETDIQTIFNYLKKLIATGERKTIKGFRKNDD